MISGKFKMAAAARCLRSLTRSTSATKHLSSYVVKNVSQKSSSSVSSPLLKSFLSTDSGLIRGSGMSSRISFNKRFAPVSFVCAVPKACPLSIDGGSDGVDALDGNLGDDDGDTWSQGEDDPYLGVT
ncbi:uncharacterized protein LOC113672373 [Pocillopora damicornis]|uniref:uncharacterized protein LOC113672373 n=1 Tax=Pocillopora damicornis TaxID=46731 RepID=UPI000F558AB2|nr:uncharacterized protein LOC113672373 [Pocillopora damicornis]